MTRESELREKAKRLNMINVLGQMNSLDSSEEIYQALLSADREGFERAIRKCAEIAWRGHEDIVELKEKILSLLPSKASEEVKPEAHKEDCVSRVATLNRFKCNCGVEK